MDNSPVTPKKPWSKCPRCPHRLSDLWTHEFPPDTPTATQPLPAVPEKEESNNNEDDGGDSSSTAVEDQVGGKHTSCPPPDYSDTSSEKSQPPEYISEEQHQADIARYYELRSDDDDLHGSSDEEDDEDWKSAREYHSDEEHLLTQDVGFGGAFEDKNYPGHYTCPYDNIYHGVPVQGETTYPIGEIGEDMIVTVGVIEYTDEDGTVFLWKLCDLCMFSTIEGPNADTEHQSGGLGQFEEWKEIVDEALQNPQVEVATAYQSPSANGLETLEEKEEES
ncbi:hypothetical protein NA56DRAFT_740423 [Hyaloscypha hepaticicola]|uniref:Uncharacterized protein n=1 Tax=Hyaloscypha hepaticicola TaxID=2082293 RepID=A0A2J6PEV3_9HELO|nr:hypothetical protein NA56DRAFT_740423 [Hyaloscypha hepaticicola]